VKSYDQVNDGIIEPVWDHGWYGNQSGDHYFADDPCDRGRKKDADSTRQVPERNGTFHRKVI
jgi:hypothetical protein